MKLRDLERYLRDHDFTIVTSGAKVAITPCGGIPSCARWLLCRAIEKSKRAP
jgi:hypothetical protein